MCDQTPPYTEGTWVWAKVLNKIWWPGKIVLRDKVPPMIDKYINDKLNKFGEPFAIVYFDKDHTHEVVYSPTRVCLYNSTNKMEYIEKGYASYVKQTKGQTTPCHFNFEQFVTDVTTIETELGGDEDIFQQFKKKYEVVPLYNYRDLFPSTKPKKKSKNSRKSVPALKTPISKKEKQSLTSTKATAAKATTTKATATKATAARVSGRLNKSLTMIPNEYESELYYCKLKKGCTFSALRFENLRRHMAIHTKEEKNNISHKTALNSSNSSTKTKSPIPKKRINLKNKIGDTKKMKLDEEIINDWADDDESTRTDNEDKPTETVDKDKTAEIVNEYEKIDNEDITQTVNLKTVSEENNLNSSSVRTNTSIVKNHIFDFDDNADDDNISDLRQIKSSKQLDHTENNSDLIKNLNGQSNKYYDEIKSITTVSKQFIEKCNDLASISSCSNLSETDNLENVNDNLLVKKNIISCENDNLDINIISNDSKLINSDIQLSDDNTCNNLSIVESEKSSPGITKIDGKDTNHKDLSEDCHFRGLKNLPTPEWAVEECWLKLSNNGFNEASSFTAIDCSKKIPLDEPITLLSTQPLPFEPKTTLDIVEEKCTPGFERCCIWVPFNQSPKIHTNEELLKLPLIKKIQHLIATGQSDKVRVRFTGGKLVSKE